MDQQLQNRIEACRDDFALERRKGFDCFFCPILHVDEPAQLCKGHVVPDAFGTCNIWVPQRADVDNFFGSVAEADFVGIVQDRGRNPFEVWLNPELRRRHRPRIESDGARLEHYFPKKVAAVPGQTPVKVVTNDDVTICDVVVKASSETLLALDGKTVQLVVERDYRPVVTASILKAAHLTLFKMLGYRYVFSPTGVYVAHILREFFVRYRSASRRDVEEALKSYFKPSECMISPMLMESASAFQGTVSDNRILACVSSTQGFFATGVIVKAADDLFCVFLPTDSGRTIDTYFSFLKEPPQSIAVRTLQYCPGDEEQDSHWETGVGQPVRIPMPHTLPGTHN